MQIIFNHLYKIDINEKEVLYKPLPDEENELKSYILELLTNILEDSDSKGFEFRSETTEAFALINSILTTDEVTTSLEHTKSIAKRLFNVEKNLQEKLDKSLKITIQKGTLVTSFVKYDNGTKKIIISKAENDEYLDDLSYKKASGYPLKKKIYKAFIGEFTEQNAITKVSIFDTNSTLSAYWWRDFLELTEIWTDDFNTKKAFDVIEAKILDPLKKKSKSDHITLWNATIHYFRIKETFTINDFATSILTNFLPFSPNVRIDELETNIRALPEKHKFDSRFNIIKKLITKRFKKTIPLTDQIELHFKADIPNIKDLIQSYELGGEKYVLIKSEKGFQYFQKSISEINEDDAN